MEAGCYLLFEINWDWSFKSDQRPVKTYWSTGSGLRLVDRDWWCMNYGLCRPGVGFHGLN